MLVLSRKLGETIVIDGNVRVTITQVDGHTVRLGIEAPPHVTVDRAEVAERRKQWAEPAAVVTQDRAALTN
jgi:carbon storage regulator